MNKRQKLVQQAFIDDEEQIIKKLENTYNQALQDITSKSKELQVQINDIQTLIDNTTDAKELDRLKSRHQSKVYQKQYQDALKKQIGGILDNMQVEEFKTVSEYLNKCYEQSFLGTLFDMQGQGMPICFPMDQEAMVRAVQLDPKVSDGLYSSIGENVTELKKTITSEVSRGIANGSSYSDIAKQIKSRMVGTYEGKTGGALYRAELIARTEGHRVQVQGTMDACYEAKDRGADVVKQWDATLDGSTRPSHSQVDGEIRELDEKFSNNLMFPGDPAGGAAEVCNCRCALLQRARWAIKGGFTKMNNFTKELETFESPEDYEEFKKAFFSKENKDFMNYHTDLEKQYGTKNFEKLLGSMTDEEYEKYMNLYGRSPIYNKAKKGVDTKAVKTTEKTAVKTTIKGQYKSTEALNEYDYYLEEQESFRLSAIKEMSGADDEMCEQYLDALCGNRNSYVHSANAGVEYSDAWFYGADTKIRLATEGEYYEKAKIIDDYIENSPKYEGVIYRGLSLDDDTISQFQPGAIFKENGNLSSWTSEKDVASMFAEGRSEELGKKPVIFETSNHPHSTPTSHLSIYGSEESEVLVSNMKDSEYIIESITEKDGCTYVKMKLKGDE